MTWSSSFMLVLFQIFLMMALSSSLACSKLPGDKGQAGAAVLDEATSEPLTQEMSFAFVAAAVLDAGNGGMLSLTPGRPTLGSRTQLSQALAPRARGLGLKALISCAPIFPPKLSDPHTLGLPRGPQAAFLCSVCARPGPWAFLSCPAVLVACSGPDPRG